MAVVLSIGRPIMTDGDTYAQRRFPTTHWSLIGRATEGTELAREMLDDLLRMYLPALRAHLVVKKRIDAHQADDLLQGFIEKKVLERNLLSAADPDRGKFRTLLATSLDRYVASQWERRGAKKRAADRAGSLDAPNMEMAGGADDPSQPMVTEWARQLLRETLKRMRAECDSSQRGDLWAVFHGRILAPILEGAEPIGYDALMEQGGFKSPAAASNALVTAKRMFVRQLHSVIREYACDEDEVASEIRDLCQILGA